MRAHFGLPSVVGELNEGKVGFAFGFFSSQFWLKPRSNMNVFCSLQSMSSLRSPTSPPQASRSEFINFTTFDCTGCSPGSLPEDHRKVRLPGELVNWMMIQSICGENWRNLISRNICLHFSLSWHTRIWNLRRESFILKCCLDRVFLTVVDTIWYNASVDQTYVYITHRGKFPRPSRILWGCIFGPSHLTKIKQLLKYTSLQDGGTKSQVLIYWSVHLCGIFTFYLCLNVFIHYIHCCLDS